MIAPLTMLTPLGRGEYAFRWQMLAAVPVVHQKGEAIADLMDLLRTLGMVLTSEPRATVKHGIMPVLTLEFRARDVAELCTAWATNAKRAQTHRPSGQMKDLAILVAARCLQAITELEGVQGIPFEDLRAAMVDDAEEYFGAHSDEWLDLGVDPCLRVQSLLGALGEVAGCWPISPDRPNPYGGDPEEWQFSTLFRLLFEAICAALAAERGLWQEEES